MLVTGNQRILAHVNSNYLEVFQRGCSAMRSSELVVIGGNDGADSVRLVSSRDEMKENVGCVVVEMRALTTQQRIRWR